MSKEEIQAKNAFQELNFHVQIHYGQNGIQSVDLDPSDKGLHWTFFSNRQDPHLEALVNTWFDAYCHKENSSIQLPLDWRYVPKFTQLVLQKVGTIPFGSHSTYGQIAQLLGRPQAARAVGGACGRNPFL